MSSKDVGSMPYSSGGRPATAFRATFEIDAPSYSQALVPSSRVTNFGARSAYFDGNRPSNICGGSTTWSSTLTKTRSLMSIERSDHNSTRPGGSRDQLSNTSVTDRTTEDGPAEALQQDHR